MWEDPVVAELHRIRQEQAAQYGYDIKAIVAALRRQQRTSGRPIVLFAGDDSPEPVAATNNQ